MRDKYGVGQDPYCYPDADVLVNKLNIRDEETLAAAEIEFTTLRYKSYTSTTLDIQEFTLEHLQRLHLHLFQDVYDWAGELRTIDISKGATRFCTASRIKTEADRLFRQIPLLKHAKTPEVFVRHEDKSRVQSVLALSTHNYSYFWGDYNPILISHRIYRTTLWR